MQEFRPAKNGGEISAGWPIHILRELQELNQSRFSKPASTPRAFISAIEHGKSIPAPGARGGLFSPSNAMRLFSGIRRTCEGRHPVACQVYVCAGTAIREYIRMVP
jgi:hypothetical protein